jgi:hypothetical protein
VCEGSSLIYSSCCVAIGLEINRSLSHSSRDERTMLVGLCDLGSTLVIHSVLDESQVASRVVSSAALGNMLPVAVRGLYDRTATCVRCAIAGRRPRASHWHVMRFCIIEGRVALLYVDPCKQQRQ